MPLLRASSFCSAILVFAIAFVGSAHAAVTLLDKDDWKVLMSGFIETDMIHDSTRSQTEVVGNSPTARREKVDYNNGRTAMSIRNSRLAFTVLPPVQDEWKSKGHLEFDLLGFDPSPSANNEPKNTESGFYSNPTLRVRHAYFNAEKDGWTYLMGQYWTLFGWQPNYVLTTASVPPGPGNLYQRTVQAMAMKSMALTDANKLQLAASLGRPSQRDSEMPNVDVGLRWSNSAWTGGFASPSGDVKAEPLSVGLSATFRKFATAKTVKDDTEMDKHQGTGLAANILVPILPADEHTTAGSLVLTGEYSQGTGYADEFVSWKGVPQLGPIATGATVSNNTNIDAGQGAYDTDGKFHLLQLQSWNTQLQYQLPGELHTFVTVGYSKFNAMRLNTPITASMYDSSSMMFANVFHDCTKQIRIAAEYAKFTTRYVTDGMNVSDHRIQLNGYFRF